MLAKRLALVLLIGCASSVPSNLPSTSAASEAAQPAPLANVGVALREDPPLPGAKSTWPGLPAVSDDMSSMPGMTMPLANMDGGMSRHAH